MIADDLFAGAGGWDLAAAELGIHARGVENMKEARATRDEAGLTTIHDDVWTFEPDGMASGLIASPPCQTFSTAGKGAGSKSLDDVLGAIWIGAHHDLQALRDVGEKVGDDRTALVLTPLHFAVTGGYRWLAWEQVPTVLPVWQACAEVLDAAGWSTWTGLLHAEQYGVPQTRKRAFLLASLDGPVSPPEPTHSRYYSRDPGQLDLGVEKWVSMAEALGYEPDRALRGNQRPEGGRTRVDDDGYILRPMDEPSITVTGTARLYRWADLPAWAFRRPSTTIVGSFKPEIVAAPGYRTTVSRQNAPDSVRVTVAEAGILQSFPIDFPWQGARGKQFLQCGNAVPPGLALHALAAASGLSISERAA